MNTEPAPAPAPAHEPLRSFLHNWMSLTGLLVALGSLFSFVLLFLLDLFAHFSNPYIGILTYMIAPAFLILGLFLLVLGAWLQHRHRAVTTGVGLTVRIDLNRPHDRRNLIIFLALSAGFLFISAVGSYYSYHFTESVQFCGQTCHTVMEPERVLYQHSPHARVACTECHIGPGATWFVRSKLSGLYQVYATAVNKYPRPISVPIKNLRPARDTCEQCHWPEQFTGNVERMFVSYLSERTNPVYAARMLLRVGGANPARGPVSGIHWHMSSANRVQYIAADPGRQTIPWVRLTDAQGTVTEYRAPGFTNNVGSYEVRTMDCIDCHNRPSHNYTAPNEAVDLALRLGRINPELPWIKTNAVFVLVRPYTNLTQALQEIAATLANEYPRDPRIRQAIVTVQEIYRQNFFPEMRANWRHYPSNIGHKNWPGCNRCHDDKHVAADGKRTIPFKDCHGCHVLLAQGSGAQLEQLHAEGVAFEHPGGDYSGMQCADCHTGGP